MRNFLNKGLFIFRLALIFFVSSQLAHSQTSQIIVGFPPGGPTDLVYRRIAQELSLSGINSAVKNAPGASGISALQSFVQSEPNSSVYAGLTAATLHSLKLNNQTSLLNLIEPITLIGIQSYVIVTASSKPFKSIKELINVAKSKEIYAGTSGDGTLSDLCIKQFSNVLRINVQLVPYRGTAPALQDLIASNIDFACFPISSTMPYASLLPLAITMNEPSSLIPNIPTLESLGIKGVIRGDWIALIKLKGSSQNNANNILKVLQGLPYKSDFQNFLKSRQIEAVPPESMNGEIAQNFINRQLQ